MSVVNRMLRDLDRRHALAAGAPAAAGEVRAVTADHRREWFWRVFAALVFLGVIWVGWLGYQLRPRPPVATPLALTTPDATKPRPAPRVPEPPPVVVKAPTPVAEAPVVATAASAPAPELLKLARSIETPIGEQRVPSVKAKPMPAKLPASASPVAVDGAVTKRDRPRTEEVEAESLFRQGVAMLNQGRISEAQQDFGAALKRQPAHEPARQALASLLLERGQLDQARRVLEEGLVLNPMQAQFAAVLARILVERRDYAGAATILASSGEAGRFDAEYQVLLGAVLQRLGRHAEAADALKRAVELKNQPAATWVALGASLEATGRKPEALEAYRRSLLASAVTDEARGYAETRIRALR
jgi:MSHA biogenesis protein MshN